MIHKKITTENGKPENKKPRRGGAERSKQKTKSLVCESCEEHERSSELVPTSSSWHSKRAYSRDLARSGEEFCGSSGSLCVRYLDELR
jgi:hypothetical protein